jgi:hypothetical protein
MELGDTIEASDRVERLPLDGCQRVPVDDCDADVWRRCDAARFVLIVWYWANLALTSLSILVASCDMSVGRGYILEAHLLQGVYDLGNGLVGTVLDFVPLETPQVLLDRF